MKKFKVTYNFLRLITFLLFTYSYISKHYQNKYLFENIATDEILQMIRVHNFVFNIIMALWVIFCLSFILSNRKKRLKYMKKSSKKEM